MGFGMIGKIINEKYQVTDKLGAGGSGEVYKAIHTQLKTFWALKIISSSEQSTAKELEILKNLSHPAFPRLVDVIHEEDKIILVFDYYEGPTLQKWLDEYGKIEESRVSGWAAQILDALYYLHENAPEPIIYRDLKPSNLIVLPDNSIKLIDFGTARLFKQNNTDDTVYLGTPGYAAPEQYGFGQTDVRTDIYNFGMTMFHLLTGKHPLHCNDTQFEAFLADTGASELFKAIVMKCIAKNPEERFFSIDEIKKAFRQYDDPPGLAPRLAAIGKNAVEISVSGIQSGIGTTHSCYLFGMWLQSHGLKTAVLEYGENRDDMDLCRLLDKQNQVQKNGFFKIQGLSIFPSMGREQIDAFSRADYDYILIDYGVHDEYISSMMRRSDVRLIMAPGADWKMGRVGVFLNKYGRLLEDRNTYIAFPLQNQKSINIIQSYYRISNIITIPFAINPWKIDDGVNMEIGNIYEKLFQVQQKARNIRRRRK